MGMVFQNFALLPWLNVKENVLFGSDAQGVSRKHSQQKASSLIKKMGLEGFEHAYVNELSGGMKQRVGFARALMIEPEILFFDEPFSSLDIATAKHLREDILQLWLNKQISTKSMVLVTHSVEEAILLADRVVIFDSHPGRVHYEHKVDFAHPRNLRSPEIMQVIDLLSDKMYSLNQQISAKKVVSVV